MFKLPTPCHIIDMDTLYQNLQRVDQLKKESGCMVLLAVKGFSAPYLFGPMRSVLDGVSASGLYEARLGKENFGGYVQTYSPAFDPDRIDDVCYYSDTVVFNSAQQLRKFGPKAKQKGCACGIRINPLYSEVQKQDADPCRKYSCLGIPITDFTPELLEIADGIHVHAMCEQYADSLERMVEYLEQKLGGIFHKIKWMNLGGGQLIGHSNYDIHRAAACLSRLKEKYGIQVILEPCEGILTQCGYFATKILDIVKNEIEIALVDASPVCHMQDAVFRGWQRDIIGEVEEGYTYQLSGPTCFAGDTFGIYSFPDPLKIGDIIFFQDTAAYTWVKNNAFNGIPFPNICTYSKRDGLKIEKTYGYDNFFRNC